MSFGFGFALPHWQTLSGGFTPASLFSSGEQGAWYDPSDLTTLFTDSAGTTPVTAVEQAVGLMLDKSKGLALGSELVTGAFVNGVAFPWPSFSASGTGFTASVTGSFNIYQVANPNGISLVNGRWYRVSANITQSTDDAVSVSFQNSSTGGGIAQSTTYTFGPTTASTITFYLQATSTSTAYLQFSQQGTTITFNVASVTVKELPGNHAYQSTSTSRPVLRARYNLLTYSEQFDNAAWTKAPGVSVSANTDVAPDGTLTADTVTSGANELTQGVTCVTNTVYTDNLYFKKTSGAAYQPGLYLLFTGGTTVIYAVRLNTDTGVATAVSAGGFTAPSSFNVQDVNGYWRLSISGNSSNNTTASLRLYTNLNAGGGSGAGSQIIWGAQLIVTNSLLSNAYQRIAAATDYDTSGFLPYLAFDGTDDSLLTNSVDFTATDKMTVWAGARKNLDQFLILAESSSDLTANNGSFAIYPGTVNIGAFGVRGTTFRQADSASGAWGTPATVVLCGQADIAQPVTSIRVNGTQSNNTASLGTGNFGNYPLYIGRRNNATLPFNGNLYSLIIRGAQSSAAQISSTETWVNGKTGAY
jgi:hypothetical protein